MAYWSPKKFPLDSLTTHLHHPFANRYKLSKMSDPARGGPARKPVGPRGRGRRTAEDRARVLEEEQRRTRARNEERIRHEQAEQAAADRAKRRREQQNGRRRARGGFMGDRQASDAPSGPFSLGSVINRELK